MRAMWIAVVAAALAATVCAGPVVRADVTLDQSNSWAFNPAPDKFAPNAVLDLSAMNEKVAGEKGFVKLSADGDGFLLGDGTPVRFWSTLMEMGNTARMTPAQLDHTFAFLAKRGINMVRLFNRLPIGEQGAKAAETERKLMDTTYRCVAAAKKHGVYSIICPYWARGDKTGVLFFDPQLQAAYRDTVKKFYTTPNPYTGIALKDDPAVAIIQIQNEDGMFFWTMQNLPDAQMRILDKQFGDWLVKKYGTLDKAKAAWDGFGQPGDDFPAGIVSMVDAKSMIWDLTQPASGGKAKRLRDETEFLARTQYDFYKNTYDYLRNTVGLKQLINASNWKTADQERLQDLERWTYTACQVDALNRYTGGIHTGKNNGYRIDPGHYLVNRSDTLNPLQLPVNVRQTVGMPFIITEDAWVNPNLYQSEGPMMVAAYMGLTGVDSLCWFETQTPGWDLDPRRKFWPVVRGNPAGYAITKWSGCIPEQVGMFPANALIHRLGYVKQGPTAVAEVRSMEDLWERKPSIISEAASYDPNRDTQDLRGATGANVTSVSRLAFLVGPVTVQYGGNPADTKVLDLTPYIDGKDKIVRADTGEMELHYGAGLFMLKAPKAQGVCGFLKNAGGSFDLPDVSIQSSNDYAAIEAVAMDNKPLKESGKVLVQVGTVSRLTDWKTAPATFEYQKKQVQGEKIVLTGRPPWRVANTEATITIANPGLKKATLLNVDGYAIKSVPVQSAGGKLTVKLPSDTMYLVLE